MTKALTKFRRRRRWLRVATAIAGALVAAGVYVTLARAEDESCSGMIGPISFEAKQTGERNARNWHVAFDAAGAGNVAWSRCCDTRRRKSESTGNTNFDLNRRASLRPYR